MPIKVWVLSQQGEEVTVQYQFLGEGQQPGELVRALSGRDDLELIDARFLDGSISLVYASWVDPAPWNGSGLDSLADSYRAFRERKRDLHLLKRYGLTVDIFVIRDHKILLLKRPNGIWYLPGGLVDKREDPLDAVVRETLEETGLVVERPTLLRIWNYILKSGRDAFHATFVAETGRGDVKLSDEHSEYKWMPPSSYLNDYLPGAFDARSESHASFYCELRKNLELLQQRRGLG